MTIPLLVFGSVRLSCRAELVGCRKAELLLWNECLGRLGVRDIAAAASRKDHLWKCQTFCLLLREGLTHRGGSLASCQWDVVRGLHTDPRFDVLHQYDLQVVRGSMYGDAECDLC